ncbi:MAG: dNTP triphosphohydrolase [Planctomycetes bacterium]|nr:dNTP triphosphohydrolase [Planctomycetota bacterium]
MDLSREHPDSYAGDDPALAVDRQRVIHSAAFRRLQYKTQVFVAPHGDHFRSRLTHTLEVASLARSIADALGFNAELAEIAALAHDLGHPPFGHAGERALDECMRQHGGRFEHNQHTLRVVTELEHPYPEFRGLNLTEAVRACLRTHTTAYDRPDSATSEPAPLEGQVVAQADQLAYVSHDFQDGLYAGLLAPEDLTEVGLWRTAYTGSSSPTRDDALRHLRPTVERMQTALIDDLRATFDGSRVELSDEGRQRLAALRELLHAKVYRNPEVARMDENARRVVHTVFNAFVTNPERMPARYAARVERDGAARVAADYVAGMTDRFCQNEHTRLCDARKQSPERQRGDPEP